VTTTESHSATAPFYTGAAFDTWDSTGTRSRDVNVFTAADDLVAVTFLSVRVGPLAAYVLLGERGSDFSEILEMIGPDRDLVDEAEEIPRDWPAWELDRELTCLPDVGPTLASKLIARKRPRLVPVYDSVVRKVLLARVIRRFVPVHSVSLVQFSRRRASAATTVRPQGPGAGECA
jgi:Family of unknown function (DUF6308)